MNSGIYCIRNEWTSERYVGQSINVFGRLLTHEMQLRKGKHKNRKMQKDFIDQGLDGFSFHVLEFCPIWDLTKREQYWIDEYRTIEKGYNRLPAGINPTLIEKYNIWIQSLSKAMKDRVLSDEHKKSISEGHKGMKFSIEHRKNISKARKESPNKDEIMRKINKTKRKRGTHISGAIKMAKTRKKRGNYGQQHT